MMEVSSGATFPTSSGGRREYRMSLDVQDLIEQLGGDEAAVARVKAMKPTERARQLRVRCDIYVVSFLADEGEYSKEHAMSRLQELRAKL